MNEGTCRWISVEERLPKYRETVLGLAENGETAEVWLAEVNKQWRVADNDSWYTQHVTHWLEVIPPPPPKKKVKKEVNARISELGRMYVVMNGFCLPSDATNLKVTYEVPE